MNVVDLIEVDSYIQFLTKVNAIIDTSCLEDVPKNAGSYKIKMFNTRKELIDDLKVYSQSLNSYIVLSGSLKDPSKDLVVLYLDNFYTDFDKVVIGGHYA